jgi:hypothetical protein
MRRRPVEAAGVQDRIRNLDAVGGGPFSALLTAVDIRRET